LMRDGCKIDFANTVDTWELNGGNLLLAYKDDVLNCHKALIRFSNILCTGSGRLEKDSLDKLWAINKEMLTYSQNIFSKCLTTMTADDIKGI
ncbi:MAG: hypothetical protein RSD93_08145, partial [Gordonibacter sp.]|uniref:hypothetical protein n=1 Tax=Gordonibacter sp. TaxID=1968902 RepID=UPI002FC9158F